MKDNSFDRAMREIAGQHEAIVKGEIESQVRAEKRERIIGRVRWVFVVLLIFAIGDFVFNYYVQQQKVLRNLPQADGTSQAGATPLGNTTNKIGGILKGAQENAATRDAVIDSIGK